jgi:hypothetical protein
MNPKSKKSSKPFIVEEIDDDIRDTSKVEEQIKVETIVEKKTTIAEVIHVEEEKTTIAEVVHVEEENKEEEEKIVTVTEHKEEIVIESEGVKQTVTTEEVIVEESAITKEEEDIQVSEEKIATKEVHMNDSKDYGLGNSNIVESIDINQEHSKEFDAVRDTIEHNNEEIDIIIKSQEALETSQEELDRHQAIEEVKALALVRIREATEKKTEANKINRAEDSTSEEYFSNLRKSLEIYNEGVRLIDPVLHEMIRLGLRGDKSYQDVLTEKRNLYANIALAHQRLRNFDEALRYNNLVSW